MRNPWKHNLEKTGDQTTWNRKVLKVDKVQWITYSGLNKLLKREGGKNRIWSEFLDLEIAKYDL